MAADKFRIKVRRFRPVFNVRVIETTGDGDLLPFFEHSGHLYMRFVLQGWMLGLLTIGLSNLISAENPLVANMEFNLAGTGRKITTGAILETIAIEWDRQATVVGLAITGQMHNTDVAGLES